MNTTHDRRCAVCWRLIATARRAAHPVATTCGASRCQIENRRRVHLANQTTRAQTNGRAAVDTSPPKTWAEALARLSGPVTSDEAVRIV